VKDEKSRVSRSNNWTGRNKDGGGKGKRCIGVANIEVCQECSKVLGIGELLLLIYLGLCNYSQTITQYGEEGPEMKMDRKIRRSI